MARTPLRFPSYLISYINGVDKNDLHRVDETTVKGSFGEFEEGSIIGTLRGGNKFDVKVHKKKIKVPDENIVLGMKTVGSKVEVKELYDINSKTIVKYRPGTIVAVHTDGTFDISFEFEPMYPLIMTPWNAYLEAMRMTKDCDVEHAEVDQITWILVLKAIAIVISENRVYMTASNVLTVVMAVGVNFHPSRYWVLVSFVAYIPTAIASALQVCSLTKYLFGSTFFVFTAHLVY